MNSPDCKICGSTTARSSIVDSNRSCSPEYNLAFPELGEPVCYYQCRTCGFLFTDYFDDWDKERFSKEIYNEDYIHVDPDYRERRPLGIASRMTGWLGASKVEKMLDYGSGAGVFAKALRQAGHTCGEYDTFSSPQRPSDRFPLITAWEVMEHSPTPISTFDDIAEFLEPHGSILFSTLTFDFRRPCRGDEHWYIGPRNGHVSCYSIPALMRIADRLGGSLRSNVIDVHVIARGSIPVDLANEVHGSDHYVDTNYEGSILPTGNIYWPELYGDEIRYLVGPANRIIYCIGGAAGKQLDISATLYVPSPKGEKHIAELLLDGQVIWSSGPIAAGAIPVRATADTKDARFPLVELRLTCVGKMPAVTHLPDNRAMCFSITKPKMYQV